MMMYTYCIAKQKKNEFDLLHFICGKNECFALSLNNSTVIISVRSA